MNQTVTSMHFVWARRFTRLLHIFFFSSSQFVHDRLGHQHQHAETKLQQRKVTFLSNFYKTTEWQVHVSHFESSHDFHSVSFHTWNRVETCSILKHDHCLPTEAKQAVAQYVNREKFSASMEPWFVFVSQLVCQSYYINLSTKIYKLYLTYYFLWIWQKKIVPNATNFHTRGYKNVLTLAMRSLIPSTSN